MPYVKGVTKRRQILPIPEEARNSDVTAGARPRLHTLAGPSADHPSGRLDLTPHKSSHDLPSRGCWEDTMQKALDFIGVGEGKSHRVRCTPESGHSRKRACSR